MKLGMQKSTVHRVLAQLITLGYVEQDAASGCYRASLRLWEIGTGLIAQHPLKRTAAIFLQQLHQDTRETVSLTMLSGDDVLYLDKIVSPRPIRFTSRVGSRAPACLTASGKAMLAWHPDARAMIRRANQQLEKSLRVASSDLMAELAQIRQQGYAESSFRPGVVSFGAPVMGQAGGAPAAISVSAPESRLSEEKRADIIEHLLHTCAEIAERAGGL